MGHTGAHIRSSSTQTHEIRSKSEKLFVDGRTDGRTDLSSNLLAIQAHFPNYVLLS